MVADLKNTKSHKKLTPAQRRLSALLHKHGTAIGVFATTFVLAAASIVGRPAEETPKAPLTTQQNMSIAAIKQAASGKGHGVECDNNEGSAFKTTKELQANPDIVRSMISGVKLGGQTCYTL